MKKKSYYFCRFYFFPFFALYKKVLLQRILERVAFCWQKAWGFLSLLQAGVLTNADIDQLLLFFHRVLKSIETKQGVGRDLVVFYEGEITEYQHLQGLKQEIIAKTKGKDKQKTKRGKKKKA